MRKWEEGKPPHEQVVEVEYKGRIMQARAIWGNPDRGILPHWELSNGVLVHPSNITRWRKLHDSN